MALCRPAAYSAEAAPPISKRKSLAPALRSASVAKAKGADILFVALREKSTSATNATSIPAGASGSLPVTGKNTVRTFLKIRCC